MIFDQSVKLLNGFVCRSAKDETLTHELCPQCYCPEHTGMTCLWCDCVYIKEKKEMTNKEAIDILLKYVTQDHADHTLQEAVQVLKQQNNEQTFDNIVPISNFPKRFEVGVRKTETILYEVLHNTQEEAIAEVQKKVNERDWDTLLAFPPGSPEYSPIPPFTKYKIKDVTVKEQVLRPNPHSEGGSSDT
tara:strand:- start:1073 stop:1639 length:567 start_codon:yes stop_codon:yes gene_type:complete